MRALPFNPSADFTLLPFDLGNPEVRHMWEQSRPAEVPEGHWLFILDKHLSCLMALLDSGPENIIKTHGQWVKQILASHTL